MTPAPFKTAAAPTQAARTRRHFRLLILASAILHLATTPSGAGSLPSPYDIDPSAAHPRNTEGSFITLKSGRILLNYSQFSGGAEDFDRAQIAEIHSDDQGETWSRPRVVVDTGTHRNVMSVSLLRLASGRIARFHAFKNSRLSDCHVVMSTSDDEGATWSPPRAIHDAPGYFVLNNDRVIQTHSGRLIVPMAFHRLKGSGDDWASWDSRGLALWYYSDDEGATWRESDNWWALPIASRSGLQEPGVVELNNGNIYSWSRTDRGMQYQYWSKDDGKSFGPPEPSPFVSPNSPLSIKRIPGTNTLVAVYNDHSGRVPKPASERQRAPLVISLSRDEARSWDSPRVIEGDLSGWYCYTAIHFTKDTVLLAYVAGNERIGRLSRLRIRRIPIEWLAAGQSEALDHAR
ncbi:MAG: exo-alpha-sialidase [Opitutaceae bacterium]|nr:exo-alpha-sialidase [Opitutaceae bacterium]